MLNSLEVRLRISRVKEIANILFRNKIGNYTLSPFLLLGYLITEGEGANVIRMEWDNEVIQQLISNKIDFSRSIAFLKSKDILQIILSRGGFYRINYRFIKNIVASELDLDSLLEINKFLKGERKIKKVKFIEENKGLTIQELSNNIKQRRKQKRIRRDSTELYGEYRLKPSLNPKLNIWKGREIDEWRSIDFLGYYIFKYREIIGYENISLQNDQAYIKFKNLIRKILEDWFGGDKNLLRDYIDWGIYYFTFKDKKHSPSIDFLFNPYRKTSWIYDLFMKDKSKMKNNKDKSYASLERWKKDE